jgi:Zn-dependent protease with chaperone function
VPEATRPDRVHFLVEQRRNRRRSRRFGVFAVVAVALAGLPLCVIIAPLLVGGLLVVGSMVDIVAPLGAERWAMLHDAVFVIQTTWRKLLGDGAAISWRALALIYLAPGAVLMLVAWPFVRMLTRRAGAGSLLHALDSRAPDPTRITEQQTVNVVSEMAVAAGIRPPLVRVIDSPAVNAVAIGLSVDDATVLVTTGFLERLNRDERQAIVAHLIGSVGNGDLEIAATIFSVFATWTLVAALIETPFSRYRRAYVAKLARVAARELRGRADDREVRAVMDPLLAGIGGDPDELESIMGLFAFEKQSDRPGCLTFLGRAALAGINFITMVTARESTNLFTVLVLGPWLSAMWRARRRLADATAIELTRNPEGLASAIRTLAASDVELPNGWLVHFLFPVWVPATATSGGQFTSASTNIVGMRLDPEPRLEHLAVLGASTETRPRVRLAARVKEVLSKWEELATVLGWAVLAAVGVSLLMAIAMLVAAVLLIFLWDALRWVTAPFELARRFLV